LLEYSETASPRAFDIARRPGRNAHLNIAKALFAKAKDLLAKLLRDFEAPRFLQ
jgi:hypothetical protein